MNISKSSVKNHAHALFVGANLKITPRNNDKMQEYLLVYFWE